MRKDRQEEVLATSDVGCVAAQADGGVQLHLGFVSLCLSESALLPLCELLQDAARAQWRRRQQARADVRLFLRGKV